MKKYLMVTTAMLFMIIMICGTVSAVEGNTTKITPLASNGTSYDTDISDDGNWITYTSDATNIVAGDTDDPWADVFLFNRQTGITTKITPQSSNGDSLLPSISGDGNWITYISNATNIVVGDTSDSYMDVFLFNRQTGITTKVTPQSSNGYGYLPSISGDGNWITYTSNATNIVAGDTQDSHMDVFLFNRQTGITTKVTPQSSNGYSLLSSISGDGSWITYLSNATNIVVGDMADHWVDVFLFNRQTGITTKVTPQSSNGESYFPSISGDGNWITYTSNATNIVVGDTSDSYEDVFLFNRQTGITTKVTPQSSNGYGYLPSISGDGSWITYLSNATNIVVGDTSDSYEDVFLFNRQTGITTKVTPQSSNGETGGEGNLLSISGDGNWITYLSNATNIVAGDTADPWDDVFLYDNPLVILSSSSTSNTQAGNEVNAASNTINMPNMASTSNTISMQETGLPLTGLILAILAVFVGSVTPRRK